MNGNRLRSSTSMASAPPRRGQRGFTMAEAAVSILIVSIMLVAALNMVATSARARQINARLAKGSALAHELMSEVLQARYEDPNPVALPVTGSDQLLYAFDTNSSSAVSVTSSSNPGQYFFPTLPANATSWSISRVLLSMQNSGLLIGSTDLKIQLPNGSDFPSGSALQRIAIPAGLLPLNPQWMEFKFNQVTDLDPCTGICVTLTRVSGLTPARVRAGDNNSIPNKGLLNHNGDMNWSINRGKSLLMYVYGSVTTLPTATATFGPDLYESTSSRADFDDVDDYDNWSASPPQTKGGAPLTEYIGWSRAVVVDYVMPSNPVGAAINSDEGMKRITVTVTDKRGERTVLVGLRTVDGAYEEYAGYTKSYVNWLGVRLQIGKSSAPIQLGTAMVNEPVMK